MKLLFILCNLVVFVIAAGPLADYCFVRCSYVIDVHIVCKRLHSCPPPKNCKEHHATKWWRQKMLNNLNDARNALASGSSKFDFGNPGAKLMYALSYDMELEYIVTCFLNQCQHSYIAGCVDSVRFPAYFAYDGINEVLDFNDALWNRYTKDINVVHEYSKNNEGILFEKKCFGWCSLHYWEAKYVGCASAVKRGVTWVVCLFGPVRFNQSSKPIIYKFAKHSGEIGSECKEGKNRKYPALCGKIDDVPAGEMWSRQKITPNSSNKLFCSNNISNIVMIFIVICTL